MAPVSSVEHQVTRGAILMIVMRWGIRIMGLLSVVILARILEPEDFGIIAMALLFQALMEGLFNLNVELSLIRNQQAGKQHYDTAWSVGVMQFGLIASLLAISSSWIAEFYGEPRLEAVIWVLALALLLRGLVNIGVVDFRKNLKFDEELRYHLITNAIRVIATIGFAFWLQSYWAMALGILAGSIATLIASYAMSPFRPTLGFAYGREIMSVSGGVWLVNLNRFAGLQGDRLIVGKLLSIESVGGYTLAVDLARLPSSELILPLSRAMIPGYAKVKHDQPRMAAMFRTLLHATALFGAPLAWGFPLIAADFTQVVLGEKWMFIVPLLEIAAILAVIELVSGANRPFLLAAGSIKSLNILLTTETLLLLGSIYPALQWAGLQGVLLVLLLLRSAGLIAQLLLSARTAQVNIWYLLGPMIQPMLAGAAMAGFLLLIELNAWPPFLRLITMAGVGGVIYLATVYLLWRLFGRPPGPVQMAVEKVSATAAKFRSL